MKRVIPFRKDKPYPVFDPNTDIIPGIPNWKRNFGKYKVYFSPGKKKYKSLQACGDYVIHVSPPIVTNEDTNFTDKALWKILKENLKETEKIMFLKMLYKILQMSIEEEVYNLIIKSDFKNEIKIVLYALWHRAIIEDRIYPPPENNGRKRIIGLTYSLIMEKTENPENIYNKGLSREKEKFEKLYQQFEREIMNVSK